jgi:hypothetical protein
MLALEARLAQPQLGLAVAPIGPTLSTVGKNNRERSPNASVATACPPGRYPAGGRLAAT